MRHRRPLTPPLADATSKAVEAVAAASKGWSLKGRGQRRKQKVAMRRRSPGWAEVERSVDREADKVS